MSDPSSIGTSSLSGDISDSSAADAEQKGFLKKIKSSFFGSGGDSKRDGIREMLEDGRVEHLFRSGEQRILGNLVNLENQRVDDIMVPRADIVALPCDKPIEKMISKFSKSGFSRLPVYRESLDDVAGMVHIKDLIGFWGATGPQDINSVLREVLFVPPNMPVLDLLFRIQNSGVHVALVVDEYGGVDGLVTIEDLVEAVVGEIADSRDRTTDAEIRPQPDGSLIVDARVPIKDFEQHIGLDLVEDDREEDIDTIGGLVFALVDRVPELGEEITHPNGLRLIVLSADPRRIHTLRALLP